MSYILEALERSERERQQQGQPSFRQDQHLLHLRQQKRFPWIGLLVAVLFLNALVFLYIHFSSSAVIVETAAEHKTQALNQTPVVPKAKKIGAIDQKSIEQNPHTLVDDKSVNRQKSEDVIVPVVTKAQVSDQNSVEERRSVLIEPRLLSNQDANHEELDSGSNISALDKKINQLDKERLELSPLVQLSDVPLDSNDESVNDVGLSANLEGEDSSSLPLSSSQVLELNNQYHDVLFLHEISNSARPRVPKLLFNSHIYSSDPSARRVMINNIYLREGQMFEGMTVLLIDENHVVFEKQGQQFKIAAMRDWLG
ncbi:hypothetical protein A3762_07595 [Oleiphilus sp. HI0125]|nr:general secretion pathway protein GspB [Oleiphilus sp. HI0125]KZZ58607.1 hypothetical protein A3762_07595 [Oleiphilus sp. HI0125]